MSDDNPRNDMATSERRMTHAQGLKDKVRKLMSAVAGTRAPLGGAAARSGDPGAVGTATRRYETVLSHVMERSILHAANVADFVPFAVAGRTRRATCSGVAWFAGYHLAVVNLYGGHLRVYRFDPGDHASPARLDLLHEVRDGIEFPEDVAVSPDAKLIAIGHALSKDCAVTLFGIDPTSLAPILPAEKLRAGTGSTAFHGVNFSPDSRHLLMCEITNPGYVEVVRVTSRSRGRTCFLENRLAPLKPKSAAISHDGHFAAIAMGLNGTPDRGALPCGGRVVVHRFDAANGVIDAKPVAEYEAPGVALAGIDLCTFFPTAPGRPYRILVVDQGADAVPAFEFDPERCTITPSGLFAEGLSFPHGVDVSSDGRFVAFSNYGDDSVRIDRVGAGSGPA
jgi:hypothetical protein